MNDQMMQLLTQQMAGGKAPADWQGLMMQMLQEQQSNTEDSLAQDKHHAAQAKKLYRDLRKAKQIIQAQRSQLRIAAEFINQFADLIGACPNCLGQIEECPSCHGHGSPGSRTPDQQLLSWIEPARRQLLPTPHKEAKPHH